MTILRNLDRTRISAFLFSSCLYAAAAAQVALGGIPRGVPELYMRSFWALFAVSVLLSIALLLDSRIWTTLAIIFGRICILIVMGYPLQQYIGVELTLGASLLVESTVALPGTRGTLTGALYILMTMVLQRRVPFLGDIMTRGATEGQVGTHDILSLGIYLSVVLVILTLLRRAYGRVRRLEAALKQLRTNVRQLVEANASFQDYATVAEKTGKDSERDRITREIHDSSGYVYTNLIALLEVAISMGRSDPERLSDILFDARDQAREGLLETRRWLRKLRESTEHEPNGTIRLLRLVKAFQHTVGTQVHTELGNSRRTYGSSIDLAIYRLVQEALTNAIRHGHATEIWIYFWEVGGTLQVYIRDNGVGAAHIEKGLGITGMEERIRSVGGILETPIRPDGFHIVAGIPVITEEVQHGSN